MRNYHKLVTFVCYGILLLTLLFLALRLAWQRQKPSKNVHTPLACVRHECLYKEDIEAIMPSTLTHEDKNNALFVEQYVETWLVNQELAHRAENEVVDVARKEIEKRVFDFRSKLLIHAYLEKIVNQKLKQEITDQEIRDYYQAYQENFKLKNNILRGKIVVVPKNAPQIARLKQIMLQDNEGALKELKEYCAAHAAYFSLDNKLWLKLDDIVPKTFSSNTLRCALDQASLFKKSYLKEMQDVSYRYYLQIDAHKSINDIAPMELVRDQIAKVILYKRKIQLRSQIREDILQQVKANNDYITYENKS